MVADTMQTTANRIATVSVNAANTGDKETFITLDTPINHGKYKRIISEPFRSFSGRSLASGFLAGPIDRDRTCIRSCIKALLPKLLGLHPNCFDTSVFERFHKNV